MGLQRRAKRSIGQHARDYAAGLVPITKWLPKYNLSLGQSDLIAGLTVGLMVVPQALAYASIAGLPHQYGLYSAFMGCFVYVFFGSSKDVTLGPTAIMSLLTAKASQQVNGATVPAHAIFLTFMAGVFQLAMGLLRLGFVVDFISFPVINGFTTSAAITIGFGQVKHLLGLNGVRRPFIQCVHDTFSKLDKTHILDLGLGLLCICVLMYLKALKARCDHGSGWKSKLGWFLGTARNAVVVVLAGLFAYGMVESNTVNPCEKHGKFDESCLTIILDLPKGLPDIEAPELSSTYMSELLSGAILCALIGYLESIAIGKAFARQNGYKIDQSQELVAIGSANIVSSFFQSYPITGSFSRTAVNSASGVMTPLAGSITGVIVVLALQFMTGLFYYIPQAALGAIIISSVATMVDVQSPIDMWRVSKMDLLPYLLSFWLCLLVDIKTGVLVGVAANILIVLFFTARPGHSLMQKADHVDHSKHGFEPTKYYERIVDRLPQGVAIYKLNASILFPAVADLVDTIEELHRETKFAALVLDCEKVDRLDFTAASGFKDLNEALHAKGARLFLACLHSDVEDMLVRAHALDDVSIATDVEAAVLDAHQSVVEDGHQLGGNGQVEHRKASESSSLLTAEKADYAAIN